MISVTEKVNKKLTTVKWYWKKNKFVFGIPPSESFADSELKIDCFDPTTKGTGSFIGSVTLTGEELSNFLNQDWASLLQITLKKDPKRDDKQRISKGTINLRGGLFGSRLESERLVDIKACHSLPYLKGDGSSLPTSDMIQHSCYCIVYWNHVVIGRTKPVSNDGNPVWEMFDDKWCLATEVLSSPMYYAASELFIEVWECDSNKEGNATEEDRFLGSCWLTGHPLQEFLESLRPVSQVLPLYNKKKPTKNEQKSKKKKNQVEESVERAQGFIVVGTPGTKDKTPLEDIERTEDLYSTMLKNEIQRSGTTIFER